MQRFAFGLILFTLFVITLGALTRLLDAGLGCPDWPVCYGSWIPAENVSHTVFSLWDYDQGKAWMEMIHRYGASLLGLLVCIQAVMLFNKKRLGISTFTKSIALMLCVWVVIQGLFGMWTVTLRLWPPVVSAHLLGGAITLGLQFLIWRSLKNIHATTMYEREGNQLRTTSYSDETLSLKTISGNRIWLVFTVLVFAQMALGAWTSSQYAGLACPDFPTCQGRWWIEIDSGVLHAPMVEGDEYLGGVQTMKQRMAVQWLHRLGAVAVLLAFFGLCIHAKKRNALFSPAILMTAALLLIQITLGILNAVLLLPLTLALLHNTFAMLLWMSSLYGLTTHNKKIKGDEGYHGKDESKDRSFADVVA